MNTQILNSAILEHSKANKDFLDYPVYFDGLLFLSPIPAVDELYQEITQTLELGTRRLDLRVAALKVILANVYHAYELGAPVGVSRDKNAYTNLGRYLAEYCSYAIFISVMDSLVKAGWLHSKLGYYFDEDRNSRISRIWATDQLIELFNKYLNQPDWSENILRYVAHGEMLILKDKDKRLIDYLDSKLTLDIRRE